MDALSCELLRWSDGKVQAGAIYYDTGTMMIQPGPRDHRPPSGSIIEPVAVAKLDCQVMKRRTAWLEIKFTG